MSGRVGRSCILEAFSGAFVSPSMSYEGWNTVFGGWVLPLALVEQLLEVCSGTVLVGCIWLTLLVLWRTAQVPVVFLYEIGEVSFFPLGNHESHALCFWLSFVKVACPWELKVTWESCRPDKHEAAVVINSWVTLCTTKVHLQDSRKRWYVQ